MVVCTSIDYSIRENSCWLLKSNKSNTKMIFFHSPFPPLITGLHWWNETDNMPNMVAEQSSCCAKEWQNPLAILCQPIEDMQTGAGAGPALWPLQLTIFSRDFHLTHIQKHTTSISDTAKWELKRHQQSCPHLTFCYIYIDGTKPLIYIHYIKDWQYICIMYTVVLMLLEMNNVMW